MDDIGNVGSIPIIETIVNHMTLKHLSKCINCFDIIVEKVVTLPLQIINLLIYLIWFIYVL